MKIYRLIDVSGQEEISTYIAHDNGIRSSKPFNNITYDHRKH